VKLVHLVDFITKKFVTMHGHTNVKKCHMFKDQPADGHAIGTKHVAGIII